MLKLWTRFPINTLRFGEFSIQFSPFNLIFRIPRHVIGTFRCEQVHPLSRLDVYICPINITLCVTLVITQWYICSMTSFFLENDTKNPEKQLEPNSNFSI